MRVIHKYPIELALNFTVEMPKTAVFLSVQVQRNSPQMWMLVDPDIRLVKRRFCVVTTGQTLPDQCLLYLGTFLLDEGSFVGHLFELKAE